ncbi:GNAT family N-acetyltransferase [Clostridium frigidicarnis]|uniref:Ribosomal-protein-alanine N-acetyltransferase n=1 Tax=Clostridium frigidicarnis TaxID=84698 RepID=A0A1I0YC92_9CLOT|nr:GNAT family protein [Clostridium frigidicarnis]SFB10407.1 ribosomal-protein-alanine N-acetyltransferase [Clostridium frigidicarnis]
MEDEIFNVFPEISTERLNLREIKKEDAESIYKLLSNPEVIKHDTFELFTNIKQAEDILKWFNNEFKERRAIFWGISLKNQPEIIGFCKCEIEIPKVRADLGYDLTPEYWNMGIMTETLNAIIDFAFQTLHVNRIEAAVYTKNNASIRVLEKLGFVKEGILRERSYWRSSCHDMMMLSILKKEYCIKEKQIAFNL